MGPTARATNAYIAGILGGALFIAGGVGVLLLLPFSAPAREHWPWIVTVATVALGCGLFEIRLGRRGENRTVLFHVLGASGLPAVVICMAASGGADSPVALAALFTTTWAAFYTPGPIFIAYLVAACAVLGVPLLYDDDATWQGWAAHAALMAPAAIALGYGLALGRRALDAGRRAAEEAAAEQTALRRVAVAAADERSAPEVFAVIAREAATLLGGSGGVVLRADGDAYVVEGAWSSSSRPTARRGARFPASHPDPLAKAFRTGRPVRLGRPPDGPGSEADFAVSLNAPVRGAQGRWGAVVVVSDDPEALADDPSRDRLGRFATLTATALAAAQEREELVQRATTDPLTGAANHRAFHERLRHEVARATRHARPLSLVLLDVDHFKWVNDTLGHEQGDHVLRGVVDRLRGALREEDVLARLGGDELAVVLPETASAAARDVVERARRAIAAEPVAGVTVTVSAGICDLESAEGDAERLVRYADGALYWGKLHGRDAALVYDPEVVQELSEHERAERLERSQAMRGIRALARAIDAKDPSTHEHSERVAALSASLATALGWLPERVRELREAALVHDVGKIGLPDHILTKPGRLTEQEYREVQKHAALGAEMVDEVLSPEQARWIRHHHERPDGRGYPDGLVAGEIPPAAALMAMADSWDVMTAHRPYSAPKPYDEALAECRALAGAQFTTEAVAALEALHREGRLADLTPAAA